MRTHAVARSRGGFQEAVCRAIKRSVQATTKTTAKTQKASPLRNRLAIESAIVRWKIDQSHASVDRTRLRRPLSESVMTFGPFMAWDKSRPPRALIRTAFRFRASQLRVTHRFHYHIVIDTTGASSGDWIGTELDLIIIVTTQRGWIGKKLYEKSKRNFRSFEKYFERETFPISRQVERNGFDIRTKRKVYEVYCVYWLRIKFNSYE